MYEYEGQVFLPPVIWQQNSVKPSLQRLPDGQPPGATTAHAETGRRR